tara:strand:+ start:1470 stop:2960 length:1491 start_codon:yes stop_codon:yes gene_type:complete
MGIETLGKSLLASAKQKSKKQEKKAKVFTGLMLGIQVGNHVLRKRAEKRANEFWSSNQGVIANRTSQFDKGVNFWKDDKSMLNKYGLTGVDDWKIAKRNELYDFYKTTDLGGKDPKDLQQFKMDVDKKIEDDLAAYGDKRRLYTNFRDIGRTETDLKTAKTNFLKPLQDKLDKGADIIKGESNVGGYLLANLGLKGKAKLEPVTIDGQRLMLPFGYDKVKKDALVAEMKKDTTYSEAVSSINNKITYTPLTSDELKAQLGPQIYNSKADAGHASVMRNAISGNEEDRLKVMLSDKKYNYKDKDLTVYEIYTQLINADSTGEQAQLMASQILGFAKQEKLEFETSAETNDLPPQDRVKTDDYFVDKGVRAWLTATHTDADGNPLNPGEDEIKFDLNEIVSFNPTEDISFNKPLATYRNDFQTALNTKTQKEVEGMLIDYQNSLDDFSGKEQFIRTLQDLYNNKYESKEPSPFSSQGSFFQANKNFRNNPLSIPGRNK